MISPADRPAAHCPLCGGTVSAAARFERNGFRIHACERCGVHFVHPQPTPKDLLRIYDASYFQRGDKYREAAENPARLNDAHRAEWLARHVKAGRILDVGCATGGFLGEAAARGFQAEGVEPSADAAATARTRGGFTVHVGDLASARFADGRFDAVTLWDVIEHVPDPVAVLTEVRRILRPGGILLLSTGDIGSRWARLTGRRWQLLTPPQHVFYFTRKSMTGLLERTGFGPADFAYEAKRVALGFVLFKARETFGPLVAPAQCMARLLHLDRLRLSINLGDIMTVATARRP